MTMIAFARHQIDPKNRLHQHLTVITHEVDDY